MAKPAANRRGNILSQYDPESPLAAELRRLYQNMIVGKSKPSGSFLFTSAVGGEGKSTCVAHLAATIAAYKKKKILVIDGDVRRSTVHRTFGLERENGLFECLVEGADPMEVVKQTSMENLDIMTAGAHTDLPSQLFEANGLSSFFEKVEFYYDIVLVDSPPVLAVSDTLFLCRQVPAVVYVLLAGVTPREVVRRAMRVLHDAETNVLGVVVNNAAGRLPYHYEPDYYGQYYST